jgi:hypothetical protein
MVLADVPISDCGSRIADWGAAEETAPASGLVAQSEIEDELCCVGDPTGAD